jgi:hypothetical protein
MVDGKTKQNLLKEIEKFGNVYLACLKIGVDKATYYRWKQKDEKFRERADEAERIGRENISDIAEHALLQNIKEKNQRAIEYALNHNSEIYKQKQTSNVVIVHRKEAPIADIPIRTLEDLIDEDRESGHERALKLHERFTMFGGEIPNKPDGTPIALDEIPNYEAYIENWQRYKRDGGDKKSNHPISVVDPKPNIEVLLTAEPQEDRSNSDDQGASK